MNAINGLLMQVRAHEPGALDKLVRLPKVRQIIRVRAAKAGGFPWTTQSDLRADAVRCVWEVAESIKDDAIAKLKYESSTLAYLSGGVRNRLFRQLRSDLSMRETTVVDNVGRKRFELQPKVPRAPFDLALAQVDTLADPYRVLAERESALEVLGAYRTAPMSAAARQVLRWRTAGVPGEDMKRRLRCSGPVLYKLLRDARAAVRDKLWEIRSGAPSPRT